MCANPMDRKMACVHKDTDSMNWAMEIIVFLTNSDVTSFDFYFYFYIFLYEIMISDPEMPLFHMERLLFLCICIYVYLYVCRLRYVLYVSSRFLETCDSSDVSERETSVFLALFIWKKDLLPHLDSRKPNAAHTMLCCYLKNFSFFLFFCQIVDHPKSKTTTGWKPVINLNACFSSR